MSDSTSTLYAFLGGVLPAILWLLFWLNEDAKRPEPKGRIIETFLAGMVAVILVLPFQKAVAANFPGLGVIPFTLWALSEELFKFLAAYIVALRTLDDDEPIDNLIYMITAALGFVALENALFIWNPLLEQNVTAALLTGGTRFLGASLLHVLTSSVVGAALAFAFFKSRGKKLVFGILGLVLAIILHTLFNLFILERVGASSLVVFVAVWVGIVGLLWTFEKVKTIQN